MWVSGWSPASTIVPVPTLLQMVNLLEQLIRDGKSNTNTSTVPLGCPPSDTDPGDYSGAKTAQPDWYTKGTRCKSVNCGQEGDEAAAEKRKLAKQWKLVHGTDMPQRPQEDIDRSIESARLASERDDPFFIDN